MATAAEQIDVAGVAVRFTSPDKMFFPDSGERDQAKAVEYYLAVATDALLGALRDRPTHLQRFPDGIEAEEIYQKRVPEASGISADLPGEFSVRPNGGRIEGHPPIRDHLGRADGHRHVSPWQVRCPDTDHPDELRIDLDPQPGTGFAEGALSPSTCSSPAR